MSLSVLMRVPITAAVFPMYGTIALNLQLSHSNPVAAIDCGTPPDAPTNGQRGTFNTTFMSTVTYSCNTGYALQGDSTLTCMANEQWSPSVPTCNGEFTLCWLILDYDIMLWEWVSIC